MTSYRLVHANVHGLDFAVRRAAEQADVLALNESTPTEDQLDRLSLEWSHRRAASNVLAWRGDLFTEIMHWREEILEAKPGIFGWKSSHAIAVYLDDDDTHERVLQVCTHFPSKAFTSLPWRRKAWREARRNLRLFVDRIQAEHDIAHVPVIVTLDGNRTSRWEMYGFRTEARPVTFGPTGRYDRILARGSVNINHIATFRTGSDHKAVSAKVEL